MRSVVLSVSAAAFMIAAVVVAHLQLIDNLSRAYTTDTLQRALVTFGIARGLNGVISVAQGTEIAIEPAGIGLNFAPGQILDPVNDLVERFSAVMLAASTSLGIQRITIEITSSRVFTAAMAIFLAATLLLTSLRVRRRVPPWLRRAVFKIAAVLLVIRFAVPAMAIASEAVYSLFLAQQYQHSTEQLEHTTASIGQINRSDTQAIPSQGSDSLFEGAKRLYQSAAASLDVQKRMEEYKRAAADVTEYAVNLIVVFTVQTILFPVAFFWITLQLLRAIARAQVRQTG
jgi:hypothetical protein